MCVLIFFALEIAGVIGYIYYNEVMFQYFMCVLIVFALEIAAGVIYYNEVCFSTLCVSWLSLPWKLAAECYRLYLL